MKYALTHDSDGFLGTLYLDLLARPGKYGGAAHMVLRCGRHMHAFEGGGPGATGPVQSGPALQFPSVALLASFPWGGGDLREVRMVPRQVETLFHEFGHALHSLMSRTEFQHLSGVG